MHVRAYPWSRIEAGLTGNLAEADANPFECLTGAIQIAIKKNSGTGATDGAITVYQRIKDTDTVYAEVSNGQYPLISNGSRISNVLNLGAASMFKLVVSGFVGTYNYDLFVRDCIIV